MRWFVKFSHAAEVEADTREEAIKMVRGIAQNSLEVEKAEPISHFCKEEDIEFDYSRPELDDDGYLVVRGRCRKCGRKFEKYFSPGSIWDVEREDWLEEL